MITFIIGLVILIAGGIIYGSFCEKIFQPDDRPTPAYTKEDGVDFVPMKQWKNSLVNLLNIAGTGPILGPIQGILFGPIAFITIPLGCVLGGAMHDYFIGMISEREGGLQMPELIKKYTSKGISSLYTVFVSLLLLLVGAVFIYTPGDIMATQIFGFGGTASEPSTWIIYAFIFIYYLIATVLPIDKIIGKIYPIFGAILILSAAGLFIMMFVKGFPMVEIWQPWSLNGFDFGAYFREAHFIPTFFITVACGILSGFHATQTSLISRTISSEKEGRMTFYNMMIVEGFIAMVWAASTMAMIGYGAAHSGITMKFSEGAWQYFQMRAGALEAISPTSVVGVICKNALGPVGGVIAIIGVIVLPVTTGDTALRSLRLILSEAMSLKQDSNVKRIGLAMPIFAFVAAILVYAKLSPSGFNILWKYFGWSNQTIAIFALAVILIWMMRHDRKKYIWMPAIPLLFYSFIISSHILYAPIGLRLPLPFAYLGGLLFMIIIFVCAFRSGNKQVPNQDGKDA